MGTCIAWLKDKELTKEHIVPMSVGGGLAPKILCNECNSQFGTIIDAKFLEQIQIRLACACEEIIGRANRAKGAFEGVEGKFDGTDIKIVGGKGLTFKVLSDFDVDLESENQIRIHGTFDANLSSDYVKMLILQNLPSRLRGKYPDLQEDEIQGITERVKGQWPNIVGKISSHDTIKYSETLDLAAILLEFGKIAYELACIAHGKEYYLKSKIAADLRNDLNTGTLNHKEYYALYPKFPFISDLLECLALKKCHAAIILGGIVHIQLFSTTCSVKYIEDEFNEPDGSDSRIYIFGHKGDVKEDSLMNWISKELKNDSVLRKLWLDFCRRTSLTISK